MAERGKYIVIEGADGVGKTTQLKLLNEKLIGAGIETVVISEPGDTLIGRKLREDIETGTLSDYPLEQFGRFTEDRKYTWENITLPALKLGKFVISGRNWISSFAYQGYGQDLDLNFIDAESRKISEDYYKPALTIVLTNNNSSQLLKRIQSREQKEHSSDKFESKNQEFKDKVEYGYSIAIAVLDDIHVVPTEHKKPEPIADEIWNLVTNCLLKKT